MKVPGQVFKNSSGVCKAFLSNTQNSKAVEDRYLMSEYIIIRHSAVAEKIYIYINKVK